MPEKNVEKIYKAILNDDRNKGNIILLKEPVDERTFPQWSMGFRHMARQDLANLEGYSDFLREHKEPEDFANNRNAVVELLYQFKESNN